MYLNVFTPSGFVMVFAITLGAVGLLLLLLNERPIVRKQSCVNQFSRKSKMRGNKWGLRLICALNNLKFIGAMLLLISLMLLWMATNN
jgi:hypothetical protein